MPHPRARVARGGDRGRRTRRDARGSPGTQGGGVGHSRALHRSRGGDCEDRRDAGDDRDDARQPRRGLPMSRSRAAAMCCARSLSPSTRRKARHCSTLPRPQAWFTWSRTNFAGFPNAHCFGRAIADGLIGEPRFLAMDQFIPFCADPETRLPTWWFDEAAGGGWLGAGGSHLIDQIRAWLGDFRSLSANLITVLRSHQRRRRQLFDALF